MKYRSMASFSFLALLSMQAMAFPIHVTQDDITIYGVTNGQSLPDRPIGEPLVHTSVDLSGYVGGTISSYALDGGGSVTFTDQYGNHPGVYSGSDYGWFDGAPDFVGTHTREINLDFSAEAYVVGLEFIMDMSYANGRGWVSADSTTGGDAHTGTFHMSALDSPFSFGVYYTGGRSSCDALSSVTVDPNPRWGIADVKVIQDGSCAQVPEPGSLSLLGAGLLALGSLHMRRQRRTASVAAA